MPAGSLAGGERAGRAEPLARLGEILIGRADVDFAMGRRQSNTEAPLPHAPLEQAVQLVAQQLQALIVLRQRQLAPDDSKVDEWVADRLSPESRSQLELAADAPPAEILAALARQAGIAPESYRRFVAFRIGWSAYLQRYLTEENMRRHFDNQRLRFDGTEFEIQLLSAAAPAGQGPHRDALRDELSDWLEGAEIDESSRQRIASEAASAGWEVHARRWVRGTGDIDPSLITPLLARASQQPVSGWLGPLDTASGVHGIALLGVRRGELELEAVRSEIRTHMLIFLLEHLAGQSDETLISLPH